MRAGHGHQRSNRFAGVEHAVSLIRVLLSIVVAAAVVGHEIAEHRLVGSGYALGAVGVVLGSVALGLIVARIQIRFARVPTPMMALAAVQLLDTVIVVAHVVLVGSLIPEVAWALLVIPIVLAGQRFAARGVVISLATVVGCYVGSLTIERLSPDQPGADSALTGQRVGSLVVIAVVVTVLAEWFREGWREQADQQAEIDVREQRLGVVEACGRAVLRAEADQILPVTLDALTRLGFVTATASDEADVVHVVGDESLVAHVEQIPDCAGGRLEVTRWLDVEGRMVYSVAVVETSSSLTITAWNLQPIDADLARLVGDAVARATIALEAASVVASLRSQVAGLATAPDARRSSLDIRLDDIAASSDPVAVLLVAVEDLDLVGESYGDEAVDDTISAVEERLEVAVGSEGIVTRCADREFVVLLNGRAGSVAPAFASGLLDHLSEPIKLSAAKIDPAIAIGVASAVGPIDPNVLRHTADRALFEAKGAGPGVCRSLLCRESAGQALDPPRPLPPPPTHRQTPALSR